MSGLASRLETHRDALLIALAILRSGRAQLASEALELLVANLGEPIRVAKLRDGLDNVRRLRA